MPKDPIESGLLMQDIKSSEPLAATQKSTTGFTELVASLERVREATLPETEAHQDINTMILAYEKLTEHDGSHSRAIQDLENQMQADENNEVIKQAIEYIEHISENKPFSSD